MAETGRLVSIATASRMRRDLDDGVMPDPDQVRALCDSYLTVARDRGRLMAEMTRMVGIAQVTLAEVG
jgi:hypothetical protein